MYKLEYKQRENLLKEKLESEFITIGVWSNTGGFNKDFNAERAYRHLNGNRANLASMISTINSRSTI